MEFFALTSLGFPSVFKDMVRSDYKEPTFADKVRPSCHADAAGVSHCEIMKEFDVYIGYADGYSYGSQQRWKMQKEKGLHKPVGPLEMYNYPGTDMMGYGWYTGDPALDELKTNPWHKPRKKIGWTSTDVTKYFTEAIKTDKYFRL